MNDLVLPGIRSQPLAGYLQALGLLRALARQREPDVRAHWRDGVFVLRTGLSADDLVEFLVDEYAPSPIVSPWNARSGFAGKGRTDEKRAAAIAATVAPRLTSLRGAIRVAEQVADECRRRGWAGGSIWNPEHKRDVISLCRNKLPDDALPWIDACVVLTDNDEGFNPLAGSGGVFGSQDLSSTYLQRVLDVMSPGADEPASRAWAYAALFGDEDITYLRGTVGQYDPGRAGGMHSSPHEKGDDTGFVNPWAQILTFEGVLLFASAAVRRHGTESAASARAALPFVVRSSAVGYPSEAAEETAKGELWAPEWSRPVSLPELERLLGEGRAEWNGRPAANGLDFVRAVSSLGVDRGLSGFTRHVFVERLGQNPLAVPVDRVPVRRHEQVWLLRHLDGWLTRVRRARTLPAAVASALRQVDRAMYEAAAHGTGEAMRALVVELGVLHEAVSRSGTLRDQLPPFFPARDAGGWLRAIDDGSREVRLAAAFASLRDDDKTVGAGLALRALLTPVTGAGTRLGWAARTPVRVATSGATVGAALAEAHRRRAMPGVVSRSDNREAEAGANGASADTPPALSAYAQGLWVPAADVAALVAGEIDEALFADYLRGLLLLDWRGCRHTFARQEERTPLLPPPLTMLLPFFSPKPVTVPGTGEDGAHAVFLRPEPGWVATLIAGHIDTVAEAAVRRLRIAGLHPGVRAAPAARTTAVDGTRLAAALLLHVPPTHRTRTLQDTCLPPPEERTVNTDPTLEGATS